jgi:hypothetical protein
VKYPAPYLNYGGDMEEAINCGKCKFSKGWDLGAEWGIYCRHPKYITFTTNYNGMNKDYGDAQIINQFGNCELFTKSKNPFKIIFG